VTSSSLRKIFIASPSPVLPSHPCLSSYPFPRHRPLLVAKWQQSVAKTSVGYTVPGIARFTFNQIFPTPSRPLARPAPPMQLPVLQGPKYGAVPHLESVSLPMIQRPFSYIPIFIYQLCCNLVYLLETNYKRITAQYVLYMTFLSCMLSWFSLHCINFRRINMDGWMDVDCSVILCIVGRRREVVKKLQTFWSAQRILSEPQRLGQGRCFHSDAVFVVWWYMAWWRLSKYVRLPAVLKRLKVEGPATYVETRTAAVYNSKWCTD